MNNKLNQTFSFEKEFNELMDNDGPLPWVYSLNAILETLTLSKLHADDLIYPISSVVMLQKFFIGLSMATVEQIESENSSLQAHLKELENAIIKRDDLIKNTESITLLRKEVKKLREVYENTTN